MDTCFFNLCHNKMKELSAYGRFDERIENDEFWQAFSQYAREQKRGCNQILLYQYKKANCYTLDSILRGVIHLSSNVKFNDAFEGYPCSFYQYEKVDSSALKLARIACLSENENHQGMWGYYADDAAGLRLEYDLARLSADDPIWNRLFPVVYREDRCAAIGLSPTDLVEMLNNKKSITGIRELFLYKSPDWSHEREWRLIQTVSDQDYKATEELPFNCLKSVTFGLKMKKTMKELFAKTIKEQKPEVEVLEATAAEHYFKYHIQLYGLDEKR